jgi:small subunit ribosomal protein S21
VSPADCFSADSEDGDLEFSSAQNIYDGNGFNLLEARGKQYADSRHDPNSNIRSVVSNSVVLQKLLQRFKRTVAKEGLLKEIKKRSFYEKPSEAKRRKQREFEKLMRKKDRKQDIKDSRRKLRRR